MGLNPKHIRGYAIYLMNIFSLQGIDRISQKYFFDIGKMRTDADYEATIDYDQQTAMDYIEKAKAFNSKIKDLIEE